jgi:hypothetical protein
MKLTEEWFKNELERWKTGEWCTECEAPRWIVDDVHYCADLPTLQEEILTYDKIEKRLRSALKQVQHYFNILKTHKDISEKDAAFKLAEETVRVALNEQRIE